MKLLVLLLCLGGSTMLATAVPALDTANVATTTAAPTTTAAAPATPTTTAAPPAAPTTAAPVPPPQTTGVPPPQPTSSPAPAPAPTQIPESCPDVDDCDSCVKAKLSTSGCVFCDDTVPKCQKGGPTHSKNCYYETCKVNSFTLLVIILPCVGGGLLLIIGIWIWCCCRRRNKNKLKIYSYKESKKEEEQRKKREEKQSLRRAERSTRTDEIRRKYGLLQENESDDEQLLDE
eukprot:m.75400 g.75400  ORF g.75400 m.75400 type:complete len:232 (-) comp17162_c0_seq4:932-1627(-)